MISFNFLISKFHKTNQQFKKNIFNFFTYSFGAILTRLITSLLAFISINFLSESEYGLLSLINNFIGILPIFFNLGLRQAFWIDYFHNNHSGRKQIIADIISIYIFVSLPIVLLLILNSNLINKIFFVNNANSLLIYLIIFISFLTFFIELFFQVFKYQEQPKKLVITQTIMGFINVMFFFSFIYLFNFKIEGIVIANLISMVCICIYAFYLYVKKINKFNLDIIYEKKKIVYYLKLGFPFIPSILFSWILSFANRWLLVYYKTFSEVGIYSVSDSFSQLFQVILLVPLINIYQPYIFKKFNENKDKEKHNINESHNGLCILVINQNYIKNIFYIMSFILVLVLVGFILLKKILYIFLPNKFHACFKYILILLIGQVFFLGSQLANCFLVFLKKTYILMWIMFASAILNIILNFILIPKYALYGCAFATLISYFFNLICTLICNFIFKNKVFRKN